MQRRVELAAYWFCRGVVAWFCRLFWRVSVTGAENLPNDRPYILSPVHRSNVDTPVVAVLTGRRLHYMGKDSMWKFKPIGWFFTAMGSFPVHRGTADREALRKCIDVINGGEPLVLFPEGTRREGPVVEDLFEGAAYVASRTGAPIVPVGIGGSQGAMPRGSKMIKPVKIALVVGPPMEPERSESGKVPRRAVKELTDKLQVELQRLFDEAQKRAGVPPA